MYIRQNSHPATRAERAYMNTLYRSTTAVSGLLRPTQADLRVIDDLIDTATCPGELLARYEAVAGVYDSAVLEQDSTRAHRAYTVFGQWTWRRIGEGVGNSGRWVPFAPASRLAGEIYLGVERKLGVLVPTCNPATLLSSAMIWTPDLLEWLRTLTYADVCRICATGEPVIKADKAVVRKKGISLPTHYRAEMVLAAIHTVIAAAAER